MTTNEKKPTTGAYSIKPYKCNNCNHEFETGTNHWGEIYTCPLCQRLGNGAIAQCLEPVPEGYGVPEKWKLVKLGDICEIHEITCKEDAKRFAAEHKKSNLKTYDKNDSGSNR